MGSPVTGYVVKSKYIQREKQRLHVRVNVTDSSDYMLARGNFSLRWRDKLSTCIPVGIEASELKNILVHDFSWNQMGLEIERTQNDIKLQNVWTMDITAQGITENVGAVVTQNEWTLSIAPQAITENEGVDVTQGGVVKGKLQTTLQNEWTLNLVTAQSITQSAGVAVTQGTGGSMVTGTLKTALQNEWILSITSQVITADAGTAVTQGTVTGTLKNALTGATTSIVILAASGYVTFYILFSFCCWFGVVELFLSFSLF